MKNEFYELKLVGLTRKLPKVKISETLAIASFVMLGDTELVEKTAEELVKRLPVEKLTFWYAWKLREYLLHMPLLGVLEQTM